MNIYNKNKLVETGIQPVSEAQVVLDGFYNCSIKCGQRMESKVGLSLVDWMVLHSQDQYVNQKDNWKCVEIEMSIELYMLLAQ